MTPALRLTLQRDDDGTCGLDCAARYDGFAGRGLAYFNLDQIQRFCDALGVYPLPTAGVALTGGYGEPTGERVVTLGLTVRPTDSVGSLDLVASLAEYPVHNLPSLALQSACVRMPVTYEALRSFSRTLRALVDGTVLEATLDAPYRP